MLINLLALIALCTSLVSAIDVKCNFIDYNYIWGENQYTCETSDVSIISLNTTNESRVEFTNVIGDHQTGRVVDDVKQVFVPDQTVNYIPAGIGKLFRNIKALIIENSLLYKLQRSDFDGLHDLTALLLSYNRLEDISDNAFDDLSKVEYLSLSLNQIKSLSDDTFVGMKSLKRLHVHENKIERIGNGIFRENENLEVIWLQGNRLKYIGADFLVPVKSLYEVFLGSNVCINDWYTRSISPKYGGVSLESLNEKIANYCSE